MPLSITCSPRRLVSVVLLLALLLPAASAAITPTTLTQQAKLTATGTAPGDWFGSAVAVSGDGTTAIIGAINKSAAYVFTRSGRTWVQRQELVADGGPNRVSFGQSVALSRDGATALVGASDDNSSNGAAYVFARVGTAWVKQQVLTAGPGHFGNAVALSSDGNTALIGAYYESPPFMGDAGVAYIFVRSGMAWTLQQRLMASDAAADDRFGEGLALSGDGSIAVITSAVRNPAYVFVRNGTSWTQRQILVPTNPTPDPFGHTAAISGDGSTVVIGTDHSDLQTGAAYVFVRDGATWVQRQVLNADDGRQLDSFGVAMALSDDGTSLVVGAYGNSDYTGAGYLFARSGAMWIQQQKITASDAARDLFGLSVAMSGDAATVLIGAFGKSDARGAAYVFTATTLSRIAVQGGSGALQVKVGQSVPFTATGTYSDGSTGDLTGQVQWSSDPATVAKVSAGGVVTGQAPGSATITATLGGVSGGVAVTVAPPTPLGVQPAPAPPGRPAAPLPGGPSPAPAPIPARR